MERKLKIGVMGALRGSSFMRTLQYVKDAELAAVCEINDNALEGVKQYLSENVKVYKEFDEFIHSGLDGVILCNYFNEHAKYAVKAFEAGVAVLSETTAAPSLGECVELVEKCEQHNAKYMLATNCMYFRSVHAMKERLDKGLSGKVLYGEAEYIHGSDPVKGGDNVQHMELDMNNLHWRQTMPTNMYNMHSLGPLMYITGSEPKRVLCKMIRSDKLTEGRKASDCIGSVVITEMSNGAVFNTTGCSHYQPTSKWYRLACENETMETARYDWRGEKLIVAKRADYFEVTYPSEIDSGLVREGDLISQSDVAAAGHGGIDYYVTYHFIKVLKNKEIPFMDVYRAAALSAVGILGWYSALTDKQFNVPDFRLKSDRDKIRNDFRSPIAKRYEDLTMPCRLDEKDNFVL